MKKIVLVLIVLIIGCKPTEEKKGWFTVGEELLKYGAHHTKHYKVLGNETIKFNKFVLMGIDKVQKTALDGGGYYVGIKADPPESPIGYNLCLGNKELVNLERTTSYCSGASYSAFIEALNFYNDSLDASISDEIIESMRMQEPDGSRRNDNVKFWGKWNDDGYGNHFALVQYSGMGKVIEPKDALPGDFVNISWKSGNGHSVIFLGWHLDSEGKKNMVYWSSQTGTNGLGDQVVSLDRIAEIMVVRVTNPDNLFKLDVNKETNRKIKGYKIDWE